MKTAKSAKLLVLDSRGDALVLYRSETHPWSPHAPDLPGGIIKSDESFEAGVIRELEEETGLTLQASDLTKLYEVEALESHGIIMHRIIFEVKVPEIQPKVKLSWEHETFEWKKIEDIRDIEEANQKGIDFIVASRQQ